MAGSKRERQLRLRQQQRRAAAEARRRARRKRNAVVGGVAAGLVAAVAAVVILTSGGGGKSVAVTGTSTTVFAPVTAPTTSTTVGLASAAGKPCVPMRGAVPPGAPVVPVPVGPPPTQLVTRDLNVGTGATVTATDTLTVNYIGVACSTGAIFDSSYSRGQTATFPLSGVIPGWQNGLPGMKVGGRRLLGIPSTDAYGPSGRAPTIAPNEALWFVVEVVAAKHA